MIPTMFRRSRRCCALLALGGLLAFGAGCTAPTVPVPVPYTISSPDLDGNVSISGDAEVQALVLAFNEDSQERVIGVADADGRYELILAAEVGDEIAVWQRVGTTDGVPRVQTVPPP